MAIGEAQESPGSFEIHLLAPGVHAALVVPSPQMYVFANALVVEGERGVLVVDSHASPSAARAMISEIRALTDRPVRYV